MRRERKAQYRVVPVDALDVPGEHIRSLADESALDELLSSVRERGVLVPLVVVEEGERYRVLDGMRRLMCADRVHLPTVPVLVVGGDRGYQEWCALTANRLREGLNAYDEARFVRRLLDETKQSQTEIAAMLGVSESWVSERVGLLDWPGDVVEALREGRIEFAVAREFARVAEESVRLEYLRMATSSGCSSRQAAEWRRSWERERSAPGGTPAVAAAPVETPEVVEGQVQCSFCGQAFPIGDLGVLYMCDGCRARLLPGETPSCASDRSP